MSFAPNGDISCEEVCAKDRNICANNVNGSSACLEDSQKPNYPFYNDCLKLNDSITANCSL